VIQLLDVLQLAEGSLVLNITSVDGRGGLEEDDPAFFVGYWTVLDAARYDDEFAFFDPLVVVAEIHAETAFNDQEELVFVVVMVEDKFSFELVELYVLAVELGGDVRLPVLGNPGKFIGDVDLGHDEASERKSVASFGLRLPGSGRKRKQPPAVTGG
jgi:hypothetical protein